MPLIFNYSAKDAIEVNPMVATAKSITERLVSIVVTRKQTKGNPMGQEAKHPPANVLELQRKG